MIFFSFVKLGQTTSLLSILLLELTLSSLLYHLGVSKLTFSCILLYSVGELFSFFLYCIRLVFLLFPFIVNFPIPCFSFFHCICIVFFMLYLCLIVSVLYLCAVLFSLVFVCTFVCCSPYLIYIVFILYSHVILFFFYC